MRQRVHLYPGNVVLERSLSQGDVRDRGGEHHHDGEAVDPEEALRSVNSGGTIASSLRSTLIVGFHSGVSNPRRVV